MQDKAWLADDLSSFANALHTLSRKKRTIERCEELEQSFIHGLCILLGLLL